MEGACAPPQRPPLDPPLLYNMRGVLTCVTGCYKGEGVVKSANFDECNF